MLMAAAVLDAVNTKSENEYSSLAAFFGGRSKRSRGQDSGNSIVGATSLGTVSGSIVVRESVGGSLDPNDVFRFDVAKESDVTIRLSELKANLDLRLLNASGSVLAQSAKKRTLNENIAIRVPAGTYYVEVKPATNNESSYRLDLTVTAVSGSDPTSPPPPPAPPPGSPPTSGPPLAEVPTFGGANDWNLNLIGAPEAWAAGYSGKGITVAVVDSGVGLSHSDLATNLWVNPREIDGNGVDDDANGFIDDVRGWDFVDRDNSPTDGNGHGTHVAGTIAALNNGSGATGVAYSSTVMAIRVLANDGSGWTTDVAAGIRYAVNNGARVINLSIGGGYDSSILSAIEYAASRNVFVAAASGNDSASLPTYPARHSATLTNLISVGAHNSSNSRPSWSNLVGTSGAVQVDAPGVSIYSTTVGGSYGNKSGTSMATPHVAGLAALTLSAAPGLTAAWVRDLIVAGAKRVVTGSDSVGGIDARNTVAWAAQWAASGGGSSSGSSFGGDTGSGGGGSSGGGSSGKSMWIASATGAVVVTATTPTVTAEPAAADVDPSVQHRSGVVTVQRAAATDAAFRRVDDWESSAREIVTFDHASKVHERLFAASDLVAELLFA